jgi:hypothetical protein
MKISLNIPDEYFKELSGSAVENERTLTGEILYRLKRYRVDSVPVISESFSGQGKSSGLGTIPSLKEGVLPESHDEYLYEDIISRIGKSFEYELDYEGRADLNKAIKEAGLVWNSYLKKLEKPLGDKFKLIHQF